MIHIKYIKVVSKSIKFDKINFYLILNKGPNVRVDTTLLGIEGTNWQRGNRTFIFSLLGKIFLYKKKKFFRIFVVFP